MTPIRFHHLKAFGKAPLFAKAALDGAEQEETSDMENGTAGHAMALDTREVTFYPKARNEKHAEYQAFRAAHPHSHILTEKDYRETCARVAALKANPRAWELLRGTGVVNEGTLLAKIAGRECRATPDARGPEGLVELKFTSRADPVSFYYHARRMNYPAQLAWQARIARAAQVPFGPGRFIVAVETGHVPLCQVYRLPPALCEEGDRLATLWFEGLRVCEQSGVWPGYGPDEMELEAPYQDDGLDWGASDDEAAA